MSHEDMEKALSVHFRRNLEALSQGTYKSEFGREYTAFLIRIQRTSEIRVSARSWRTVAYSVLIHGGFTYEGCILWATNQCFPSKEVGFRYRTCGSWVCSSDIS